MSGLLERGQFFAEARITPQLIEGAVARYRHQPRARTLRDTFDGPAFERDQQRILHKLLGDLKVAQDAHERSYQLARLLAENSAECGMRIIARCFLHNIYSLLKRSEEPEALLMFHDGSNLDGAATGPGFCHKQRLVEVGDIHLDIASDDLVALQKGTVGNIGLPIRRKSHTGGRVRGLELVRAANFAVVFGKPAPDLLVLLRAGLLRHLLPALRVLRRSKEQKHILHRV